MQLVSDLYCNFLVLYLQVLLGEVKQCKDDHQECTRTLPASSKSNTTIWHLCLLITFLYCLQEAPDDGVEEDHEILPGGDPDAGIPVDQARVHGIERGPHITDTHPTEHLPYISTTEEIPPLDDVDNDNNALTHPDSD